MQTAGSATLIVNGKRLGTIDFDKGRRDALVWDDSRPRSSPARTPSSSSSPAARRSYTVSIEYRAARPQSSPRTKLAVTSSSPRSRVKVGEGITLRAHIENRTADGIPT